MIRNKYVFLLAVLFSGLTAIGQNSKESFFAFKEDWSPINNIDLATYFMHRVKENDTTYICRFYRTMGPMVKCETYKDEELTIPHGRFVWYNADGNIDSAGMVSNGKKDGYWEINQQNGHAAMNILFEKGKRVWTKNFLKADMGTTSSFMPMKNRSMQPANIFCKEGEVTPNRVMEEKKPAKMAKPPSLGINREWLSR